MDGGAVGAADEDDGGASDEDTTAADGVASEDDATGAADGASEDDDTVAIMGVCTIEADEEISAASLDCDDTADELSEATDDVDAASDDEAGADDDSDDGAEEVSDALEELDDAETEADEAAAASELCCASAEDDAAARSDDADASRLLDELALLLLLFPQALSSRVAARTTGSPAISLICMWGFLFGRSYSPSPRRGPTRKVLHHRAQTCRDRFMASHGILRSSTRNSRIRSAHWARVTAMLTAAATITVLKKNAKMPWTTTRRRIALVVIAVSEVCAVMPIT